MNLIGREEIGEAFDICGVKEGDIVFLHSDAFFLAQMEGESLDVKMKTFFRELEETLGHNGTLILPAFTYSFTKGEDFNVQETPGTVGLLSEFYRKTPGVIRSADPIFSIVAKGRYAAEFCSAPVIDSFGPDSVFGLLHQLNAHIICLGCSFSRITFTHFVEQQVNVPYRYKKKFSGNVIDNNISRFISVDYLVRDISFDTGADLTMLRDILDEKKILKTGSLGRAGILEVNAKDFFDQAVSLMNSNPHGLIGEGQKSKK